MTNLIEIDNLEAIIVIDNEIDGLSTIQPNTITNAGRLPNIIMSPGSTIESRSGAMKEFRMEDICCGAHGFSVFLVR
jgi:7,8-dihydropterin-6-yl-methyl-4-(beta-D-ribofuranosyl)aminobenzene 5'-phosphate synthase